MKKLMTMLLLASPLIATANDSFANGTFADNFEVNQTNCNLPMEKIRQLLPNKDDQQQALKHCTEKATKERWRRPQNDLTKK